MVWFDISYLGGIRTAQTGAAAHSEERKAVGALSRRARAVAQFVERQLCPAEQLVYVLDTLEFGTVSQNSVTELSERLFNRGYSPLQARLVRNAEYVFTGQNIGPVFAATPAAANEALFTERLCDVRDDDVNPLAG